MAFYADYEHENKPIETGYRLMIIYNLIQTEGILTQVGNASNLHQEMKEVIKAWEGKQVKG
jgi:hypothetical protein